MLENFCCFISYYFIAKLKSELTPGMKMKVKHHHQLNWPLPNCHQNNPKGMGYPTYQWNKNAKQKCSAKGCEWKGSIKSLFCQDDSTLAQNTKQCDSVEIKSTSQMGKNFFSKKTHRKDFLPFIGSMCTPAPQAALHARFYIL